MNKTKRLQLYNAAFGLMTEYADIDERVKRPDGRKKPFRRKISGEIPVLLRECGGIGYLDSVVESRGKGRWADAP